MTISEHDVVDAEQTETADRVACTCGWQSEPDPSHERALKSFASHVREATGDAPMADLGVAAPVSDSGGRGRVGGSG
jgi:hypothetical protein